MISISSQSHVMEERLAVVETNAECSINQCVPVASNIPRPRRGIGLKTEFGEVVRVRQKTNNILIADNNYPLCMAKSKP